MSDPGPEPAPRRERRRWDEVGSRMTDFFSAASTQYYRRSEIRLIQRHMGSLDGKRVLKLDLWNEAFNTRLLHWMADQRAEAYGLDISHVIATRARDAGLLLGSGVRVLEADIRHLPFASGSFDLVYTMGTIEHIAEYEQAMHEVSRVLRPGGRAIVGVPYLWHPFLRPLLVKLLELLRRYPYSPEKAFTGRHLRALTERSGLVVRHRTGILSIPGSLRIADLFLQQRQSRIGRLVPALLAPFEWAERRWEWVGLMGYLVVVVADKPG